MDTHTITEYFDDEGNQVVKTEIEHPDGTKSVTVKTFVPSTSLYQAPTAPPVAQQEQPGQHPSKVLPPNPQKLEWITPAPAIWYTCCKVYTTCQAADDFNAVAIHVGSQDRTTCTEVFWTRLGHCCNFQQRNKELKRLYEEKHSLVHQEDDCCISCMAPELISEQVAKEHQARFNVPISTAMERS